MCYGPRKQPENRKTTSFDIADEIVYRGVTGTGNRPQNSEQYAQPHKNSQKSRKRRVLTSPSKACTGGYGPKNSKQCATHENRQKTRKRRVLTSPMKPCIVVHGNSKSSLDLKTVCYSPRKQPENTKTARFDLARESVYWGSRSMKIFLGPQNSVL